MSTPAPLQLRSHTDRLRDRAKPPDWTIAGLLVRGGIGALIAAPGVGKTLLGVHLAGCVASGTPFLGRSIAQGQVIYLCPDSPASTERRMLALPAEAQPNVFSVPDMTSLIVAVPEVRAFAKARLGTAKAIGLLVIDTWDAARNHASGGYAEQDSLTESIMGMLRGLAVDCNLSVLILHHCTRSNENRARGSLVFDAKCDWIGNVGRQGQGEDGLLLTTTKARDGEAGEVGRLKIVTKTIDGLVLPVLEDVPDLVGGVLRQSDIRERRQDLVLRELAGPGPHTKQSVAGASLIPEGSMVRIMDALRALGLVEPKGFKLTARGREMTAPESNEDAA